jgi:hypothetical protein
MTYSGGQRSAAQSRPSGGGIGQFLQNLARGAKAMVAPSTGYEDWLNAPVLPRKPGDMGPKQDIYEQPGVGFFSRTTGDFLGRGSRPGQTAAPGGNTPLVSGLDPSGAVDRAKSDLYRQYAQTPEGQFERYFQTQEMAPYFGTGFQGKGAPTSTQAMLDLAAQAAAPTTAPLASFYAAQSAAGRGSMDEIVSAMGYKGTPMEQWAKANPMLAYREFNAKFPVGQMTQGPTPALPGPPMGEGDTAGQRALEAAQYQLSGDAPASVRQRADNFVAGIGNPVTPTDALKQGENIDANRGAGFLREAQKMKTQGYQQFLPSSQPLF